MKAKTPEDLAKERVRGKDKFTLYLGVRNMEEVNRRATKANISASLIVDEAIAAYLASLKDKKND